MQEIVGSTRDAREVLEGVECQSLGGRRDSRLQQLRPARRSEPRTYFPLQSSLTPQLAFVSSSYLTSVRASKEAFRWAEIETFIERAAQDLGVGGKREGGGLAAVAGLVRQLCADLETTLAAAGEAAAVVQSTSQSLPSLRVELTELVAYTPPWIARVKLIREAGQVNELAERQLASLAEEMKDLVKTLRVKVRPSLYRSRVAGD